MDGQKFGAYVLKRQIGDGGMATVYLAHDTKLQRDVAIKIIKDDRQLGLNALEQFIQEARLIVKLEHPHILPVYDYDIHHTPPYIVMRFLNAGTLADVLSRQTITLNAVAKIIGQIASAMDYAHRKGVVHRDIKPSNILIDDDGNAFVTDFGLAQIRSKETTIEEGTPEAEASDYIVGTPPYIAPEQIRGLKSTDLSDIYSLGIMLYEILTGKLPFDGSLTAILMKHLTEMPPSLLNERPDLPFELDLVIQRCLAKEPESRYQSAPEFAGAVAAAFGHINVGTPINLSALLEARALPLGSSQKIVRIFLAGGPDTTDERSIASRIIEQLGSASFLNGRIAFEIVEWVEDQNAAVPTLLEPDVAKEKQLPTPADCEISLFLLWSQLGAPLPPHYEKPEALRYKSLLGLEEARYSSSLEWLYLNALEDATRTDNSKMVVYHRSTAPAVLMDDPEFEIKRQQWQQTQAFVDHLVVQHRSEHLRYVPYTSANEFEEHFRQQLRMLVAQILFEAQERGEISLSDMKTPSYASKPSEPVWKGSPFPGLRAFGIDDASIFFGRAVETENLLQLLHTMQQRFIAVVGASGAGKSSLINAGLLPRLRANAINGSKGWLVVRFTPDMTGTGDVFAALAQAMSEIPLNIQRPDLATLIKNDPQAFVALCETALSGRPAWAEWLFFIDQFEELFTRVNADDQARFVQLLQVLATTLRFRVLVTMRADFYAQAVENPQLASLVREGTFPVSNPTRDMLRQMIELPAERANLRFEPGLVRVLLDDTGSDPGALALLAFALHQLYEARDANGLLSFEAYQKFGGVRGAIGQHAEQVFKRLSEVAKGARNAVFRNLVTLDERSIPTRQRVLLSLVTDTPAKQELVRAFIDARLLVTSRGDGDNASLEVAHEALFRSWPALADWIHDVSDDLRLSSEILKQASAWQRSNKDYAYLLHGSRLRLALDWLPRAKSSELVGALEEQFILASKAHEDRRRIRELNRLRFTTIALGALFIVIIGVLSYLISMGFSNIENELIQANMNLANESVDNEVTSMSQVMGNWSVWDDTYNFVRGEDDSYIDLNIVEEVFANVKVNTMLFYDANNALYYRRTYDSATQSFEADESGALSSKLMQHISSNPMLISHPDEFSAYEGLLSLGDSLIIAVSQPILRVDLSGFPGGTLVWGREIDSAFIDDIEERTQLDIKLVPLSGQLDPDFATAYDVLKSSTRSLYSAPLSTCYSSTAESEQCIAGYTIYKDIYGQDAALLRVAFPRTVVAQGQTTTNIGIGVLLLLGIGFTILVAAAFTRFSQQPT